MKCYRGIDMYVCIVGVSYLTIIHWRNKPRRFIVEVDVG